MTREDEEHIVWLRQEMLNFMLWKLRWTGPQLARLMREQGMGKANEWAAEHGHWKEALSPFSLLEEP